MVPMDINSIFVSCFILALVQFGSVQLKPDVWSSFATGINTFANSMVNAVVHPYSETLGFIKSQTTKDLCRRNTVPKDIKTNYNLILKKNKFSYS